MFFILSKVLAIFMFPLMWVLLLIIIALIVRNPVGKKRLLIAAAVVFLIFSDPFLLRLVANKWDAQPVKLNDKKYSCAILLGGFVNKDGVIGGYFNTSADRFIQTLKLYDKGNVAFILISGGSSRLTKDKFKYSTWAAKQFIDLKVPDSALLFENKSRNTLENAAFSKQLLEQKGLKPPYVLVTSAFHMKRALWIYKHAGLDVIPFPSNYFISHERFTLSNLVPSAGALQEWEIYIKEMIGYEINKLRALF